jgi:glycosyltransferase involved in cell wall biosynthesis
MSNNKIIYLVKGNEYGGAEKNVYDLAKYFNNKFNDFAVLTNFGKLYNLLKAEGIKVLDIPLKSIWNPFQFYSTFKKLEHVIKEHEISIVQTFHRIYLPVLYLLKRKNRITIIYNALSEFHDIKGKIFKADLYTAVSKPVYKNLTDYYKIPENKISIIPHGIEDREIDLRNVDFRIRANEKLRIGYAGRFDKVKGIKYLIKSIELVDHENISVIIQGEGKELLRLKRLIKNLKLQNKVLIKNWNDNIEEFFNEIDILILPSIKNEGLGAIILEALLRGKIVIAAKVGGILEIIEDGKNGFLVEPKSPAAIAEVINDIIQKGVDKDIIKNGVETAKHYTLKSVYDKFIRFYESHNLLK